MCLKLNDLVQKQKQTDPYWVFSKEIYKFQFLLEKHFKDH